MGAWDANSSVAFEQREQRMRYQRRSFVAVVLIGFSVLLPSGVDAETSMLELRDGQNYRGEEARGAGSALLVFRKQDASVIGIGGTPYGSVCFQGTLDGSEIHVKEIADQDYDLRTKESVFKPARADDRDRFAVIRVIGVEPFPNPRALLRTPQGVVERNGRRLDQCAEHFGSAKVAGPCNDPELVPALQTGDKVKYFHPGVACRLSESPNCTAAKVFEVLVATPSAVAPVKDGLAQTVTDCGVLVLMGDNKVKTEIDREHYIVTNYTMPGHVFWPGRVVRFVVEVDGRIDINTQGLGNEGHLMTMINVGAAMVPYFSIWDTADDELRKALREKLGIPITEQ